MKKLITILLCLPILLSAQNIPNAGFESWLIGQVVLEAEDWTSSNFYTFNQFGTYSVNPDMVDFTEGYTSARLTTSMLDTLGPFAAFLVNGLPLVDHVNGEVDVLSGGTPFPYRPIKMIGKYKFESNSPIEDFAQAHVILKKYNSSTGERDTIGYGQNVLLNPSANFQTFEVPIQYMDPVEIPDSVVVVLYSTYPDAPIEGGEMWVDDLSFEFTSNTSEVEEILEVNIFPNPFHEYLKVNITALEKGQIGIIDGGGTKVFSKLLGTGFQSISIETSEFPSGNYYITWSNQKGESKVLEKIIKINQ